jgi:hypothetical protein
VSELVVRSENQQREVAGEVAALIAVVRPILEGLLVSLKADVTEEVGGVEAVKLKMLPRLYRAGDGDCGICFEYAVHDAVSRGDGDVLNRIEDALRQCRVPGTAFQSILFGAEKKGASQLIATAEEVLTDDSRLLTGRRSQPPKLKSYLNTLAAAFRRPSTRLSLPTSINGLWKADLFLGTTDGDRYVGTTVKINHQHLESANGLRVGIVPASHEKSDRVRRDDKRNLIVCPLPYDQSFMEIFFNGWGIVQQVIHADAEMPTEVKLPVSAHRHVAKELVTRREYPVLEVIEALRPIAQPELLRTDESRQSQTSLREGQILLDGLISPVPRTVLE